MSMHSKSLQTKGDILFFDGVCNLCNGAVQFLIKRDKHNQFKFASLQSQAGQAFCKANDISTTKLSSVIYYKNNSVYQKSSAALHALSDLGGLWKLCSAFLIIPKFIRDFVYDLIGKNRYRIFGKSNECMLPTAENKAKFIE